MRSAKDFFKPLAVGAPEPVREIPFRPSRMIHFFPPSNEKMVAKLGDIIPSVDIILGNLEDGVPATDKEAARAGLVNVAKTIPMGTTQLWTRVNSLDSPWGLDDITTLVTEVGDKFDVIMIPKVEGPEDIHYVDRLLAQLEAKAGLKKPLLIHAILETARGVANVEEICGASPRMQGLSLGPADLAANRRMKTTRVGGGHPDYVVPSATSKMLLLAKINSAMPTCLVASVLGHCTPHKSILHDACSAHVRVTLLMRCASSKQWAMALEQSCSTEKWKTMRQ